MARTRLLGTIQDDLLVQAEIKPSLTDHAGRLEQFQISFAINPGRAAISPSNIFQRFLFR
jgi:hypothetical protein